ncbi:HAMP domain-containing histidine kinase [Clostridium botulinum]|nr:HAMP domain-containing histidine kinase [Clostridium botulinum]NFL02440.1 HAMP domain-containing histidine kinase [Clostridium botulinum]
MKNNYAQYLKNPEIKSFIIKVFIYLTLSIISISTIFYRNVVNLNKAYVRQNTIIVGNILAKNPNLEEEIIKLFNSNDNSNYELGKRKLEKYCYDEELSVFKNPVISEFYYDNLVSLSSFIFLCMFIVVVIAVKEFFYFFRKIDEFTKVAMAVVDGKFDKIKEEYKEGTVYIFTDKFNLMIDRIENYIEQLKKEKIFKKNIIEDISHQLKTPLASIMMFNEIISDDKTADKDKNYFLKLSYEQLKRMEWLIINLLKLGRLESGAVEFNMKNTPLYVTINKSISYLVEKAKQKNVKIIKNVNENINLYHDSDWTSEAILNIVKNAIEHTASKGKIEIYAEETPLCISLYIKDNGEGIPKNIIGRIFDRFYKSENTVNPTSIGIGLSMSKAVIEEQMGSIYVESKVGEGTKFTITFLKKVI